MVFKSVLILAIVGLASVRAKDVVQGVNPAGAFKIFDENRTASPAIWKQVQTVTVNASESDIISRVAIIDQREDKNGEASIIEGGLGEKNVTIEMKSPAVFRGFDFRIEVFAVKDTEQNRRDIDVAIQEEKNKNTNASFADEQQPSHPRDFIPRTDNFPTQSTPGVANGKRVSRESVPVQESQDEKSTPTPFLYTTKLNEHNRPTPAAKTGKDSSTQDPKAPVPFPPAPVETDGTSTPLSTKTGEQNRRHVRDVTFKPAIASAVDTDDSEEKDNAAKNIKDAATKGLKTNKDALSTTEKQSERHVRDVTLKPAIASAVDTDDSEQKDNAAKNIKDAATKGLKINKDALSTTVNPLSTSSTQTGLKGKVDETTGVFRPRIGRDTEASEATKTIEEPKNIHKIPNNSRGSVGNPIIPPVLAKTEPNFQVKGSKDGVHTEEPKFSFPSSTPIADVLHKGTKIPNVKN